MPPIEHEPLSAGALLAAVSGHISDLILVKDCDGRLVFANPAALRALGRSQDEAMQRGSHELFPVAADAERIDRDDRQVLRERTRLTVEQTLHLPAGVRSYRTVRSPWFDGAGALLGVVAISTDITAHGRADSEPGSEPGSKPGSKPDSSVQPDERQPEASVAARIAALRELAHHAETVREEEKRAIARELHDDMGANLTSLSMHLQGAYALFPPEEKWIARKARIQSLLAEIVDATRRMQTSLCPAMLDLFGLKTAIGELLAEFGEQSGLACRLSLPDEDLAMDSRRDIALYRMLQEILANVARHAQASQVDVILDIDEDGLALTVRDDGIGIAEGCLDDHRTHGLRGLRERATFLGGEILIRANAGGGTTVSIRMPLTARGAAAA